MTLDESVRAMRLRVIHRAQVLGSVTAACQEAGISRTVFYRWRQRFEQYGADGLHPRRHRAQRGRPPELPPHVERLVVGLSLAWPTWGCGRLAAHLCTGRVRDVVTILSFSRERCQVRQAQIRGTVPAPTAHPEVAPLAVTRITRLATH